MTDLNQYFYFSHDDPMHGNVPGIVIRASSLYVAMRVYCKWSEDNHDIVGAFAHVSHTLATYFKEEDMPMLEDMIFIHGMEDDEGRWDKFIYEYFTPKDR